MLHHRRKAEIQILSGRNTTTTIADTSEMKRLDGVEVFGDSKSNEGVFADMKSNEDHPHQTEANDSYHGRGDGIGKSRLTEYLNWKLKALIEAKLALAESRLLGERGIIDDEDMILKE